MRRTRALLLAITLTASALLAPTTALAFTTFPVGTASGETTTNAYGLSYAGQAQCAKSGCHAEIAAERTVHGEMVTDVSANPSALVPGAALWNPPTGGGLFVKQSDVYLKLGDNMGFLEYAGFQNGGLVSLNPSDDLPMFSPFQWEVETSVWDPATKAVGASSYFQSCGQCHNTGVTRPSKVATALANGAIQGPTTKTTVAGLSIQCEVCHGTGSLASTHAPGVPEVVGGYGVLKAQVCGQCHVTGTAAEKNMSNASFGNPNGYTPDEDLSRYLSASTTIPTEAEFMTFLSTPGAAKPKFLPNGANYSMRHVYYNEWLVNKVPVSSGGKKGHADPLNSKVIGGKDTKCLGCHSGLGFLSRIKSRKPTGSLMVTDTPSLATIASVDPGISCQICHDGHVGYKEGDEGYDSQRTWGNGRTVGCEDCHNWQFEVLGQAKQSETVNGLSYGRPAANSMSRHPQREMYYGGAGGADGRGGMWGVGTYGTYMADITCADCHMPRTHKEGMPATDDGSVTATRMSHRFHIVMPGDAERWKLRPNGDSCTSSCHRESEPANWKRAQFQSWIDTTQAKVKASANEVTSTLDAKASTLGLSRGWTSFVAVQPGDGAASLLSAAEWKSLQKAAQNVDFVINDTSWGVHQPAYAMAGLAKASAWANGVGASVQLDTDSAPGTVSGSVVGSNGQGVPKAALTLEQSTDGGVTWAKLSSGIAGLDGSFSIPVTADGSRALRATFSPDEGVSYSSAPIGLTPPTTTLAMLPTAAASAWSVDDVTLTLSSSDPGSIVFVELLGAQVMARQVYTEPVTVDAEGVTTVLYFSVTSDGREAIKSAQVRIDRTAPVVPTVSAAGCLESASLALSARDDGCGVASIVYTIDGGAPVAVMGSSAPVTISSLGRHTVSWLATDKLGHSSASRSTTVVVRADGRLGTSPSARSLSVGAGHYQTLAATLTRAIGAPVSGQAISLQRSYNGRTWSTYAKLTTGSSGRASKSVRFGSKGATYWRWVVTSSDRCTAETSAVTKVVTK